MLYFLPFFMAWLCSTFSLYAQNVVLRNYTEENPSLKEGVRIREIQEPTAPPATGVSPLGLAIAPDFEAPGKGWDVIFLRLNLLVGSHRCVYGLDIGALGNICQDEMSGLSVAGLFNNIRTSGGAFQIAGVYNHSAWHFDGLQLAGGLSWTEGTLAGLQIATANRSGRLEGVQIDLVNLAEKGTGVQIGLFNHSEQLEGIQLGLINLNRDSTLPFCPIMNLAF